MAIDPREPMAFDRVEIPAIWVPRGSPMPQGVFAHPVCFDAIWIPDGYDGPMPGYPWVQFGRMTLSQQQASVGGPARRDHVPYVPGSDQSGEIPSRDSDEVSRADPNTDVGLPLNGTSSASSSLNWSGDAISSAAAALRGLDLPAPIMMAHLANGASRPSAETGQPTSSVDGQGRNIVRVAAPDNLVGSAAPPAGSDGGVSGDGKPVPVLLDDGSIAQNPRTHGPLLQPTGVSLARNEEVGRLLSWLPHPDREAAMIALFSPGGLMDYQRTYGSNGKINRDFIDLEISTSVRLRLPQVTQRQKRRLRPAWQTCSEGATNQGRTSTIPAICHS